MRFYKVLFIFCPILPISGFAYDFSPWFGMDLQLDVAPYYAYRRFSEVNSNDPHFALHESGHILGTELSATVLTTWTGGVCASLAQTSRMDFGLNSVSFFGGYQWCNDLLGDCFAFSTFGVLTANTSSATRDFILYHSARWEFEAHASLGKEWICGPTWSYRTWLDLALGAGTTGSPYFKGGWSLERNFFDLHHVTLFFRTFIGFGGHSLNRPFYGYGSVRHRNLDAGLRYAFSTCYWGYIGAEWSLGCLTYNYPRAPLELLLFWRFNLGP